MTRNASESTRPGSSNGFAKRFERRPEFQLFGSLVPEVVEANVRERTVDDLRVFRISDVFSGSDEIFIGFGKPNTYLVVPDGKGGYQKFAGKSLRRVSKVENTRGLVQSGILIRLKNLPAHAAEQLRDAMQTHNGKKFWTCVNACMHVMTDAGFSSNGRKPLAGRYWPHALMPALLRGELMFEGKPVEYEVIRTTPERFQRYALQIVAAEASTLCRHADRNLQGKAKKSKLFRALYATLHAPGRLIGRKGVSGSGHAIVAPELPDAPYLEDIRVKVSSASMLGTLFRQLWGTHAFFEAEQDRVDPSAYLTTTLKAFPQPNPSLATRLKKWILFSRPVVRVLHWMLAAKYIDIGPRSECQVYDMLRTNSESSSNKYNLIITRRKITIARINVLAKLVDWVLSKHVLMSGYASDVIFAGEIWKDALGVIHVSRNSGTYRPTEEQLDLAVAFLRAVFPHLTVVKD